MKALLMYPDRDFDLQQASPANEQDLRQDLELETLLRAMAREDKFLLDVCRKAMLTAVGEPPGLDHILYRQAILKDCIRNAAVVREIYHIAVQILEDEKKGYWGVFSKYPPAILHGSVEIMQLYVGVLRKLRTLAEQQSGGFGSDGFRNFFAMLRRELGDEYLAEVQEHLRMLRLSGGVLISAELGPGNKGTDYVMRKPQARGPRQSWIEWIFPKQPPAFTYVVAERDDSGLRALSELNDRGIILVANALAQSVEHIRGFFRMLQTELAFYIGCLNLHEQLDALGEPTCFPVPIASDQRVHSFQSLYDASLALTMKKAVVGNDLQADGKQLVMITGANQGGKSTFLRSVGLAQVMMQCGMFVPAESFSANLCDGLFTHYKREEDAAMESGKLDEELSRMNDIVNCIRPRSMVLFNESFAATNEREGSEIARQIVSALLEKGLKVFFVTHLYEFARSLDESKLAGAIFLRAERQADGTRTFKLHEGEPLQTSYGRDLYEEIFR